MAVRSPKCRRGCRMLPVSDRLWLCPHTSYGPATELKGAVEEGRQMLERAGGYDAVLAHLEQRENEQRMAAQQRKQRRQL